LDTEPEYSKEQMAEALHEAPKGAFALAGLTVGLLLVAWFAVYFFIFLPRGQVG